MQSSQAFTDQFCDEMLRYCGRAAGYDRKRAELRGALVQSRQALASDSVVRFAENIMYRFSCAVDEHAARTGATPQFEMLFKSASRGGFDTRLHGLQEWDHTNFTYSIIYEWLCRHSESFYLLAKRLSVHYPSVHPEYHSRKGEKKKGDLVEVILARCRYYEPAMELLRVDTLHTEFEASVDLVRAVYGDLCTCGHALNTVRAVSKWGLPPPIDKAAAPVDFAILLDRCDFLDRRSRACGTWLARRCF